MGELVSRKSSQEQRRNIARSELKSAEYKRSAVQRELESIAVDDGQEAICRTKLEDAQAKHQQARDAFEQANFDQQTKNLTLQLRVTEEKSQDVTQELAKSTKQADIRARLNLLKKEFDARQIAL